MGESSKGLQLGTSKNIHFIIGFAIMMIFRFIPPLEPVTAVGMQILGIFLGTLYLWTTVDVLWSSVFCVAMVGLSDYDSMANVLSLAFGNTVVVQVFFMMLFAGALAHEGITAHIGRFFLTRKISEGRPWVFTLMVCLACFAMSIFVGVTPAVILMWPIVYEALNQVGYKAEDRDPYSILMVIMVVVSALAAFAVPPYKSNGLAMLANYRQLSGNPAFMNDGMYFIYELIVGLVFMGMAILICKFVFRPDVSRLKNLKIEELNKNPLPPLDARQKTLFWVVVVLTLAMLLPSFFKGIPFFAFLNQNIIGMAVVFCGVFAGLYIGGKPVVQVGPSIQKGVSWGIFFLIVAAIMLSSILTNEKTGITAGLKTLLSPLFSGMGGFTFVIFALLIQMVLTNLCNSLVIGMIFQTIIFAYCSTSGVVAEPIIAVSIFFVLSCALFTPAASPFAAMMFANTEWLRPSDIYRYTGVIIIAEFILMLVFAYPLACVML